MLQHGLYETYLTTPEVEHLMEVKDHQAKPTPAIAVEKIGSQQYSQVGPDELTPSDCIFPFGNRGDAMALEILPRV
jgi:hypothetical protein